MKVSQVTAGVPPNHPCSEVPAPSSYWGATIHVTPEVPGGQIVLCFGVVFLVIFSFAFAINGMTREARVGGDPQSSSVGVRTGSGS